MNAYSDRVHEAYRALSLAYEGPPCGALATLGPYGPVDAAAVHVQVGDGALGHAVEDRLGQGTEALGRELG